MWYLCNQAGCGLRVSTHYIKVCIVIKLLLCFRLNKQKKKKTQIELTMESWKLPNVYQRNTALLKFLGFWT